jgi:hypothetical protein
MLNTMGFFVWLMPVIFMVHEFEEIFMVEAWASRHKEKIHAIWPTKKPFGLDHAGPYLSATIGIGIFVEFLFAILISALCVVFNNYYAWFGFWIGYVFHMFFPHLWVTIKFKGYLPGIITGMITLIPSVWVLYQANTIVHYGVLELVLSVVVIHLIVTFLVFRGLHKAMAFWSRKLVQYSQGE